MLRVVSEMTYTVSSGTLNSTIPYHTWGTIQFSTDRTSDKVIRTTISTEPVLFLSVCKTRPKNRDNREALRVWKHRHWQVNWTDCASQQQ